VTSAVRMMVRIVFLLPAKEDQSPSQMALTGGINCRREMMNCELDLKLETRPVY
jgi:hypothetical protein